MAVEMSHCLCCDQDFSYEPILRKGGKWKSPKRKICDRCREKNTKASKKNSRQHSLQRGELRKDKKYVGREGLASGVFKMSHSEIAEVLQIGEDAVADIERRVLVKIRNSTGLRELWRSFIEDGGRVPEGGLTGDGPAAALLDYQLAVQDWWTLHDKIMAYGGTDEALECLAEIEKFQGRIGQFLEEMR